MTSDVIGAILSDFHGEVEHGRGATAKEIADCEQSLGVRFVGSFADYLTTFGWLSIGSEELYGLGADAEPWRRLKDVTLSERTEMYPPLPPYLVIFYNDGLGNQYCLDTRATVDAEHRIVFWNHELGPDQTPELICGSFAEWLRLLVAEYQNDQ